MTRYARDLAAVAAVLDPAFEEARAKPARDRLAVGHAPAYWRDADAEIGRGVEAALEACRRLGAEIREVELPAPDEALDVHAVIFCAEAAAYHFATFPEHLDAYPPVPRQLFEFARTHRGYEYVQAARRRAEMTARVEALFDDVDALVLPTLPVVAPRRDAEAVEIAGKAHDFTLALVRYTCLFDHTGHPVVALPASVIEPGLGASVQVVGPLHGDADVVAFATCLEGALGLAIDFTPRP